MSEELKKCAVCGMKIPVDAQMCPYCRSLQPQQEKRSLSGCLNIIGGIVLILVILAAIGSICSSPESDETPSVQQPTETEVELQQPSTTKPTTSATQLPESSSHSANSPSGQNTPSAPSSGSAATEVNTGTNDEIIPQERDGNSSAASTSGGALDQGEQALEQQRAKDRADRQAKRQERKQERQAKKNNKQAEQDKKEKQTLMVL